MLMSSDLHRRLESLQKKLCDVPHGEADQAGYLEELSRIGTEVAAAIEAEFCASFGYNGSNAA